MKTVHILVNILDLLKFKSYLPSTNDNQQLLKVHYWTYLKTRHACMRWCTKGPSTPSAATMTD